MLIDKQGKDHFTAGNFSQGVGYFYGLGVLFNLGTESDVYTASRYGRGASAHSAIGVFVDEGGDDSYSGHQFALQGFAWDLGSAFFVDKQGNDRYNYRTTSHSQGSAAHNGFSLFLDMQGEDTHLGDLGKAYTNTSHGGPSLAFFIDAGGCMDIYDKASSMHNNII